MGIELEAGEIERLGRYLALLMAANAILFVDLLTFLFGALRTQKAYSQTPRNLTNCFFGLSSKNCAKALKIKKFWNGAQEKMESSKNAEK